MSRKKRDVCVASRITFQKIWTVRLLNPDWQYFWLFLGEKINSNIFLLLLERPNTLEMQNYSHFYVVVSFVQKQNQRSTLIFVLKSLYWKVQSTYLVQFRRVDTLSIAIQITKIANTFKPSVFLMRWTTMSMIVLSSLYFGNFLFNQVKMNNQAFDALLYDRQNVFSVLFFCFVNFWSCNCTWANQKGACVCAIISNFFSSKTIVKLARMCSAQILHKQWTFR